MIHQLNGSFAVLDPNVYVQPKDEVGAGHQLQILNDVFVAIILGDFLRAPVGEWMSCRRLRRVEGHSPSPKKSYRGEVS